MPSLSSDLCTGLIKNVIARYSFNDTNVYGCFLDASKAFDRVDHSVLFEKFLSRNLRPPRVRLLLLWYTNQNCALPGVFVPLRSFLSLMVCARVEFFLQSGLRFILMTY